MPPQSRVTAAEPLPHTRWPDVRSIPGKTVAANSGVFTWKCPAVVRWRVVAFACPSEGDGTGTPRFWELAVTDQNATKVLVVASGATLAIGATVFYVACRNWSTSTGPDGLGVFTQPLPDVLVEHDWTVTATYSGAGPADTIGPANLLVEQTEA